MRSTLLGACLALAACARPEPAAPPVDSGTFAGAGRDALCVASGAGGARAGFVVYGSGLTNCTVSGKLEGKGADWTLMPVGDGECRVPLAFAAGQVTLGAARGACAYYCGPGASFAGKTFALSPRAAPAADLAGDPLC